MLYHPSHADGSIHYLCDGAKITIGNAKLLVGRSHLNPVAGSKFPLSFTVNMDTAQPSRVIGDGRSVRQLDGEHIGAAIDIANSGEAVPLNAFGLAAGGVLEHVACVVPRRPGAVGSSHIGAVRQRAKGLPVGCQNAFLKQLGTNGFIDVLTAAIVGRDDDGVLRLGGIVFRNGCDALRAVRDLAMRPWLASMSMPCWVLFFASCSTAFSNSGSFCLIIRSSCEVRIPASRICSKGFPASTP